MMTQPMMRDEAVDPARSLSLPIRVVILLVLLALGLVLRVAELDRVPLTGDEARGALAAWRVVSPSAPGETIIPDSPLLFALHSVAFSTFGATEMSVRIGTALAGLALAFTPLLFRTLLGDLRALALVALLSFSPVLLAASRFDSPAVWSMLAAVGALWALWRWLATARPAFAIAATALYGSVFLLADPAGLALALILLAALGLTALWGRQSGYQAVDLRGWPWGRGLLALALTVFVTATLFALHLPGLAAVAEALTRGAAGFAGPRADQPWAYVLLTALFYEPMTFVFAIIAIFGLVRGAPRPVDMFLLAWATVALIVAAFYGGAPGHALWLTMPLAALAASTVAGLLGRETHRYFDIPAWGKWLLALVVVALLLVLSINLQGVGRTLLAGAGDAPLDLRLGLVNLVWAGIALALIVLGVLLVSTLWGAHAALRGAALGLLGFSMVTSVGAGWSAAVTRAHDPVEWWHPVATTRQTPLLRETLLEVMRRESGGFPLLPVHVMAPQDGVVAWLLRDFPNAVFISDPEMARQMPVALLPPLSESPALAGSYVGQQFIIQQRWSWANLRPVDLPAWWLQRRVRVGPVAESAVVLWLRQDVYNGVPFEPGLGLSGQ